MELFFAVSVEELDALLGGTWAGGELTGLPRIGWDADGVEEDAAWVAADVPDDMVPCSLVLAGEVLKSLQWRVVGVGEIAAAAQAEADHRAAERDQARRRALSDEALREAVAACIAAWPDPSRERRDAALLHVGEVLQRIVRNRMGRALEYPSFDGMSTSWIECDGARELTIHGAFFLLPGGTMPVQAEFSLVPGATSVVSVGRRHRLELRLAQSSSAARGRRTRSPRSGTGA